MIRYGLASMISASHFIGLTEYWLLTVDCWLLGLQRHWWLWHGQRRDVRAVHAWKRYLRDRCFSFMHEDYDSCSHDRCRDYQRLHVDHGPSWVQQYLLFQLETGTVTHDTHKSKDIAIETVSHSEEVSMQLHDSSWMNGCHRWLSWYMSCSYQWRNASNGVEYGTASRRLTRTISLNSLSAAWLTFWRLTSQLN